MFQDTGFGLAIGGTSEPLVAETKLSRMQTGYSSQILPVPCYVT